jgi:hypothetical protein
MADGGLKQPGNFFLLEGNTDPGETSRNWTSWLQQYDFYMLATEKSKKAQDIQVATLLTILGAQGQEIFRTFDLSDEDQRDITKVKKAFTDYFSPRVKEEFERYRFYSRTQKQDESFDSFFNAIQVLISTCNFHVEEKDKALWDRIVIGINADAVREQMLNEDGPLTLARATQICRRAEATKSYMAKMSDQPIKVNEISSKTADHKSKATSKDKFPDDKISNCKYCGSDHARRQCPAYGKTCNSCGGKNHFSKVCRTKGRPKQSNSNLTHELTDESADAVIVTDDDADKAVCYTIENADSRKEWFIKEKHNNKLLQIKVDTGASCNVMPISVYENLTDKPTLRKHASKLISYSGHNLNVLGKASLLLEKSSKFSVHDFTVTDTGSTVLLGLPSCVSMGLVNPVGSVTVASQYSDVFKGIGKLSTKHVLRLKDNAKPVIQSPRRVPFRLRDKLRATLSEMETSGTIAKVTTPTDWVHPIVNVLKPDGSLRVCLDPTELNRCIKREHYALPTATEIFADISSSRVFSTLDARSGFLQLELDEESS